MPWFPHRFLKRSHLPGLLGGLSKIIAAQTLGVESISLKDSLSLSTPQAAMLRSHSSKFCGLPETECPQVLRGETPLPPPRVRVPLWELPDRDTAEEGTARPPLTQKLAGETPGQDQRSCSGYLGLSAPRKSDTIPQAEGII